MRSWSPHTHSQDCREDEGLRTHTSAQAAFCSLPSRAQNQGREPHTSHGPISTIIPFPDTPAGQPDLDSLSEVSSPRLQNLSSQQLNTTTTTSTAVVYTPPQPHPQLSCAHHRSHVHSCCVHTAATVPTAVVCTPLQPHPQLSCAHHCSHILSCHVHTAAAVHTAVVYTPPQPS